MPLARATTVPPRAAPQHWARPRGCSPSRRALRARIGASLAPVLVLLLTGCGHGASDAWQLLPVGREIGVCAEPSQCGLQLHDAGTAVAAGGGRVAVLRLASSLDLTVHADPGGGQCAPDWAFATDAAAAFNAGFYDRRGEHVGWLRSGEGWHQTQRHGDWLGALVSQPSDGSTRSRLVDLQVDDESTLSPYAHLAQSMVLFDHEGTLRSRNSPRAASRTVVASDSGGQLYVVVTQGAWTLAGIADWLRRTYPLLERAINLDGGHEAQLAVRTPQGSWAFWGEHGGRTTLRLGRRKLPFVWTLAARDAGLDAAALP